jgi:hypothetical protein
MEDSGLLVFGDRTRVFDDVPPPYEHAVRHVETAFDRDAFRAAVDDPSTYVFLGIAPCYVGVEYEWNRIPPFLGHGIWSEDRGRLLPIDKAERVFERLDLTPVNSFEKEVNVRDFHPGRYSIPDSAWYNGPAAGVLVENRRGGSAVVRNEAVDNRPAPEPIRGDPADIAALLVTEDRLERAIAAVESDGQSVTTTAVRERIFEHIVQEEYIRLDSGGVDWESVRSSVGSLVARKLGDVTDT